MSRTPNEFTDQSVTSEPSHDPNRPFQVRHAYKWRGMAMADISYFKSRSGARKARERLLAALSLAA